MAHDPALAQHIRELLDVEPDVVEKSMFGGRAFLIAGHLAVAANSRGGLMVRIEPDDAEELLADPRATRMVMRGREMAGWLRVDLSAGDDDLAAWVRHGVAYASSLPPR
ncbi:TfoX N-terminal domain-containing protein [Jatrophihabitans endophyticus]|uniref:TfoX N-terminal domain-containing protein n=1 Tax=Jatrophihabitans endophyticus TaxID=1206085 RepID=A0A1M5CAQ0_9ACTN|nr:TfoX/Sxy family protein [Jatrophihabitans endophyticus]SHF51736.1 TfoX N-terminal domain-containing protein [Jatrophihabitans endophyticus]